jgi:hypothetical protein
MLGTVPGAEQSHDMHDEQCSSKLIRSSVSDHYLRLTKGQSHGRTVCYYIRLCLSWTLVHPVAQMNANNVCLHVV